MEEYLATFEQLAYRSEVMFDTFFHECFISGLKDDIWAHVLMDYLKIFLEATHRTKEEQ